MKDVGHAQMENELRTDWLESIQKTDFPEIRRNGLIREISEKEGSRGFLEGYRICSGNRRDTEETAEIDAMGDHEYQGGCFRTEKEEIKWREK